MQNKNILLLLFIFLPTIVLSKEVNDIRYSPLNQQWGCEVNQYDFPENVGHTE